MTDDIDTRIEAAICVAGLVCAAAAVIWSSPLDAIIGLGASLFCAISLYDRLAGLRAELAAAQVSRRKREQEIDRLIGGFEAKVEKVMRSVATATAQLTEASGEARAENRRTDGGASAKVLPLFAHDPSKIAGAVARETSGLEDQIGGLVSGLRAR